MINRKDETAIMEQILIPTNFFPGTANAFNYAIQLAERTNANLNVLHTNHVPVINLHTGHKLSTLIDIADKIATNRFTTPIKTQHNRQKLENFTFQYLFDDHLTANSIAKNAKKEKCDLVVVGSMSNNAFSNLIINQLTNPILNTPLKCPVLVVPEKANYKPIRKIVYAFTSEIQEETLLFLSDLVKQLNAEIHFVHLSKQGEKSNENAGQTILDTIAAMFGSTQYQFHEKEVQKNHLALQEAVQELNADLICIKRKPKTVFSRIFSNSTFKRIAKLVQIPVLVLS